MFIRKLLLILCIPYVCFSEVTVTVNDGLVHDMHELNLANENNQLHKNGITSTALDSIKTDLNKKDEESKSMFLSYLDLIMIVGGSGIIGGAVCGIGNMAINACKKETFQVLVSNATNAARKEAFLAARGEMYIKNLIKEHSNFLKGKFLEKMGETMQMISPLALVAEDASEAVIVPVYRTEEGRTLLGQNYMPFARRHIEVFLGPINKMELANNLTEVSSAHFFNLTNQDIEEHARNGIAHDLYQISNSINSHLFFPINLSQLYVQTFSSVFFEEDAILGLGTVFGEFENGVSLDIGQFRGEQGSSELFEQNSLRIHHPARMHLLENYTKSVHFTNLLTRTNSLVYQSFMESEFKESIESTMTKKARHGLDFGIGFCGGTALGIFSGAGTLAGIHYLGNGVYLSGKWL